MLFNAWDFYLVSFLLFLFSVLYPAPPSKTPDREMLNCSDTLLTSTLSFASLYLVIFLGAIVQFPLPFTGFLFSPIHSAI